MSAVYCAILFMFIVMSNFVLLLTNQHVFEVYGINY